MNYLTYGTTTFQVDPPELVRIVDVGFIDETLVIRLSDKRAIHVELTQHDWLKWLHKATPEQRERWEIVPSGGGVWWIELDEGIELYPLLDRQPLQ